MRPRRFTIGMTLACIFGALGAAFILYVAWYWSGTVKASPDPALVPTIQWLLTNPQPMPRFVAEIKPPIGSSIPQNQEMCITLATAGFPERADDPQRHKSLPEALNSTFRIRINNQRTAKDSIIRPGVGMLGHLSDGTPTVLMGFCIRPTLAPGPQLVEFEVYDDWWGTIGIGKPYTYRWAYVIRIERQ